jgi:quercetin dioxygenase-like cupin family protein
MSTLTESPTVQPLADLAVFQPGSIVSRMLLKNKAGSVTLFAFAEGEGLSEHTAPFDALAVVTDGMAEVTIAGEQHTVGAGETLRLPASVPHAVHASADVRMLLIMLRA